ncbi:right-handed parallel beta-helix repeat-containing protein [Actinokineospora cianjurensis]|uniref:PKD domain-containing protein n=1 Tax=Actinokineospora cianjurensis TaxID=585224 RepID=A0A421AV32_9PSEU|nr:right-handed parallel beta-helix repeat-containing protein [Actinokineospora cianjurensis]RLK53590.1 PKD domain-containing protein [Actinokineospora cianjurensis]
MRTLHRFRVPLAVAAALAAVTGIVFVGSDGNYPASGVAMRPGTIWLASSKAGQLTLLDGGAAQIAAHVPVSAKGSDLRATQHGQTGYAVDRGTGTVTRIDGATLAVSKPVAVLPEASSGLSAIASSGSVYVVDETSGLLADADPRTLQGRGRPEPLSSTTDNTVLAADGTLWIGDKSRGEVSWFSTGHLRKRRQAGSTDKSSLTVSGGVPVLVDPVRRTAERLDSTTGETDAEVALDLRLEDTVVAGRSSSTDRLLLSLGTRGLLLVCSFATASCTPVPLGAPGADLGPAVGVGDRAFVPDYTTGKVWVVDLSGARIVKSQDLFPGGVHFELLERDGIVFYNDRDSERAGVVDWDGGIREVSKYDPVRPDSGPPLIAQPGDLPTKPNSADPPRHDPERPPDAKGPEVEQPGGESDPRPPTGIGLPPLVRDPTVSITVRPRDRAVVGEALEFEARVDGVDAIATAQWTFGDGEVARGVAVRHAWSRPATFQVTLAATLVSGRVPPAVSMTVPVDPPRQPPRIVRLAVRAAAPQVGDPVTFSAEVSGAQPTGWAWQVSGPTGTETSATSAQFRHTFRTPGQYTAALVVAAGAEQDRATTEFTVVPDPVCGTTVQVSVTVRTDLECGTPEGLIVAGNDIVLDLGGHTISGERTAQPNTAIKADGPVRNLTIRNGAVVNVALLLDLGDGGEASLNNVSLSAPTGTRLVNGRSTRLTFTDSQVGGTDARCGYCVFTRTSISFNEFHCDGPNSAMIIENGDVPVHATAFGAGCDSTVVKNSRKVFTFYIGGNHLEITHSVVDGATIESHDYQIVNSEFFAAGAGLAAIHLTSGDGVIAHNTIHDGNGCGIYAQVDPGERVDIVIDDNDIIMNGAGSCQDGIRIDAQQPTGVVIRDNRLTNNDGYGVNAMPGTVVDGGGNVSRGNPLGCRGVVCS